MLHSWVVFSDLLIALDDSSCVAFKEFFSASNDAYEEICNFEFRLDSQAQPREALPDNKL